MPLHPGTRLGPYEITGLLGAGGMGEVYRARDTKLNRDVAIKVLLPAVANDAERLARFSREAQLLASLNHPNIAHIHGIEDGPAEAGHYVRALVMELVEGPTLEERIRRPSGLPVEEALPIAKQIAEALEAAHEQGVIHRDLKPANIKVRPDGTVKVLDFGLAKAMDPAGSSDPTISPTLSMHATQAGIILGTAAYMSPEPARGGLVDRRADIWAFGAVLFEMLSGQRAFEGETLSDTLASVLKTDPRWDALPGDLPQALRRLLHRCLQKDPKRRLRDIGEARIHIDEMLSGVEEETAPTRVARVASANTARGSRQRLVAWSLAGLALVGVAAALLVTVLPLRQASPSPDARPIRFTFPRPQQVNWVTGSTRSPDLAISPDGTRLAFVALDQENRRRLWVRSLESLDAQTLPGTDGADSPFWSPDSRFLAFFADGRLKRIELASGATPQTVGAFPDPIGGTWNAAGVILVGSQRGVHRISSSGGEAVLLLASDPNTDASSRWPHFLPDGQHFTYVVSGSDEARKGVFIGSLDSSTSTRLMAGDSNVAYAAPGYLLFAQGSIVMAQGFDPDRLALAGEPIPIAENVARGLPLTYGVFSVSADGVFVYRGSEVASHEQLVWLDRTGRSLVTVGSPGESRVPVLSLDGSRIAIDRLDPERGTRDAWSIDVARGFSTRLTSHAGNDFAPLFSPDGTRVIFASTRDGPQASLYQAASNGGPEELILGAGGDKRPHSWSRDGKYLLYSDTSELWVLPLEGERRPVRMSDTATGSANRGHFSPDMHWVAYDSRASGQSEVYVRRFSPDGEQMRVSTNGGFDAQWRGDGKELFFLDMEGTLMAASVNANERFDAAVPTPLFETPLRGRAATAYAARSSYAVAADGQRFLFAHGVGEAGTSPIIVVINWAAGLTD